LWEFCAGKCVGTLVRLGRPRDARTSTGKILLLQPPRMRGCYQSGLGTRAVLFGDIVRCREFLVDLLGWLRVGEGDHFRTNFAFGERREP
jgi:hypothetical protein